MTGPAASRRRARLETVSAMAKRVVIGGLVLALLGVLGSAAGASAQPGPSDPVAQGEQSDTPSAPSPPKSDNEVRLVMALLIAVAAVALLGTFVYWVRTGDSAPSDRGDSRESPTPQDTLG